MTASPIPPRVLVEREAAAQACEEAFADPAWNGQMVAAALTCAARIRALPAAPSWPDDLPT